MKASAAYAREKWPDILEVSYELKDSFHSEQTPFQSMELVETRRFGRMLLLDGMVQTTEKDEFIYHEMMTHVPIISHGHVRKVLIIGGGDGGILRETLRHSDVEKVTIVEIDSRVVDFSQKFLPSISAGAFDDSRTELVIGDGAGFVASTDEKYDVVIVDSPDPIGPASVLFSREFYKNVKNCMTQYGIMTRQCGSTWMQPDELPAAYAIVKPIFTYNTAYVFAVPTYIGGFFSSLMCTNGSEHVLDLATLEKRFEAIKDQTRYYNPGVHFGAFALPGYVKEKLV
ncbi:MAG TPA: polyamine aminopropyltransferase [Phycisphaerae bacterium]|nr:polyamine aminopropyltransferase [Phycisphaerae bacterium]HPS53580.1 polyamine aminopropyltransferase [Phycisphaerae bacterium]